MMTSRPPTRVVSLGTGFCPTGNKVPRGIVGWVEWTVSAFVDAPQEQQTELVNRHFPGIRKRFDWQLQNAIDMAYNSSIAELVTLGQQAAARMDWKQILSSPTASTATV